MQQLEFAVLDKEKQIAAIKSRGTLLYVRQEGGIDIILYQVDGFYAEVYFDSEGGRKAQIQSFQETGPLDVYLKNINISEIKELL